MSVSIDEFVERAKAVTVSQAAALLGYKLGKQEYAGPCPRCGQGKDRFSINGGKQVFNCRSCGGGRDGIGLMAHVHDLDLKSRTGFLEACSAALGNEPIPEGGERETDEERSARLARLDNIKAQAAKDAQEAAEKQAAFREREVNKARGIYLGATLITAEHGGVLREYLRRRTGFAMPQGVFENIRFSARHTYWQRDEFGRQAEHYCGPAMIAPFVTLEGRITGCHETWIDLSCGPKFRPDLGLDEKGNRLPTKKMRGTKKGSLIPIHGGMTALRWVIGEGIETVAAFASAEGWQADTFYCATGDLGNLAGPADRESWFYHDTLTKADASGRAMPVRVQGPVPKADQLPTDAVQAPSHVSEILLLADGDSEPVATAAAMVRAETRLAAPDRLVHTCWPPAGEDFASAISKAMFLEAAE
ncbi:hypothetical protein GOD70_24600 [Sinorhizobium medicae]|nr:hypothetical protein [Sinorhizobium medicae]